MRFFQLLHRHTIRRHIHFHPVNAHRACLSFRRFQRLLLRLATIVGCSPRPAHRIHLGNHAWHHCITRPSHSPRRQHSFCWQTPHQPHALLDSLLRTLGHRQRHFLHQTNRITRYPIHKAQLQPRRRRHAPSATTRHAHALPVHRPILTVVLCHKSTRRCHIECATESCMQLSRRLSSLARFHRNRRHAFFLAQPHHFCPQFGNLGHPQPIVPAKRHTRSSSPMTQQHSPHQPLRLFHRLYHHVHQPKRQCLTHINHFSRHHQLMAHAHAQPTLRRHTYHARQHPALDFHKPERAVSRRNHQI